MMLGIIFVTRVVGIFFLVSDFATLFPVSSARLARVGTNCVLVPRGTCRVVA